MKEREFSRTCALKILALFFLIPSLALSSNESPPNIIVILVDDMGYSDPGCFGGEVRTPNIDQLAANGLRFTQSYNSARCCPSRASLLTGLYSHLAGIADFVGADRSAKHGPAYRGKLSKSSVTLAEVLKEKGYGTYAVGKWHVGHEELPTDRGFDEFYGYIRGYSADQWEPDAYQRYPEGRDLEIAYDKADFYATDAFNDYALAFLKQAQSKKKPFFLYVAHSSPHFPLQAPADTRDSYLDTYRKGWDVLRRERYARQQASGLVTDAWSFTKLSDVPVDSKGPLGEIANGYSGKQNPGWDELDADRREDLVYRMATFAAMVDHVDQGVGMLIKQLKESGDFDNTLILMTSDNGACYEWGPYGFDGPSRKGKTTLHQGGALKTVGGPGTHHSVGSAWSCLSNTPLKMYKHFNFEGGQCSPLIAHWPAGIKSPDRWVRTPVHLIDIMPTICQISGAAYPETYNGHSILPVSGTGFAPVFKGADRLPERTLFFDHYGSSAIRKGEWKLVRGNRRYKDRTWELYNIAKDRCETKNLIGEQPDRARALEAEWLDWAKRVKLRPYYQHPES